MNKFKQKLVSFLKGEKLTSSAVTALFIGVIIAVNAIVYALTVGYSLYITPKTDFDLSISGSMDELFETYKGQQVKILFCRSSSDFDEESGTIDETYYFHKTAKYFEERYPALLSIDYVNVLTKRLESDNSIFNFAPYQEDSSGNIITPIYNSSVIFESAKRHRVIVDSASAVFYYDSSSSSQSYQSYHGEEVFASMVSWVLADELKNVYFTTYHGETSEIYFANMLTCAGYEINTIDLRKQNIPDDADLVVISNPTTDFEKSIQGGPVSEMDRLINYLEKGGNLYVALDPYVDKLYNLEQMLKEYGISYAETERESGVLRHIVKDSSNAITTDNFTLVTTFADNSYGNEMSDILNKYDSGRVILKECAALELTRGAESILETSSASAVYAGGERVGSSGNYCVGALAKTGETGSEKNGNIFVISCVFLTANDALTTSGYGNRDFIYTVMDVAFESNAVPYGCSPVYINTETLENLTMRSARIYTALILALPVVIAVVGSVTVIKRKNR